MRAHKIKTVKQLNLLNNEQSQKMYRSEVQKMTRERLQMQMWQIQLKIEKPNRKCTKLPWQEFKKENSFILCLEEEA